MFRHDLSTQKSNETCSCGQQPFNSIGWHCVYITAAVEFMKLCEEWQVLSPHLKVNSLVGTMQ